MWKIDNDTYIRVIEKVDNMKKVSSIGYELGCNYDNFFINPKDGYMVYQKGPSLIRINENSNKK